MRLTDQQVNDFQQHGYLAGIPIAEASEAHRNRDAFNKIEQREGREKCQKGLYDPHLTEQAVWNLATDARILDCIESALGPNLLLMATHFFCKYGPTEAFVAWHQDLTYWGLEPLEAVSAWYAVDDSDRENGCMQVIEGTHRAGIRQHATASSAGNLLSINQEVPLEDDELERVVDIELKAGQISLHHGLLIHGSQPNRSQRRRCGLAMVYIPTHLRQVVDSSLGEKWNAILVRGENREANFPPTSLPFPLA